MFKKSSLGSAKNYPGGRREVSGGAFQESRQLAAEDKREHPYAVDKPLSELAAEAVNTALACICPPEPDHSHDTARMEDEGGPPPKNNCPACFPKSATKPIILLD